MDQAINPPVNQGPRQATWVLPIRGFFEVPSKQGAQIVFRMQTRRSEWPANNLSPSKKLQPEARDGFPKLG
jgi:hypothetical protein